MMGAGESIRDPSVAGRFYPSDRAGCLRMLGEMGDAQVEASVARQVDDAVASGRVVGGVFPHAGWGFSGALAAKLVRTIQRVKPLETLVLFGVGHRYAGPLAAVDDRRVWRTPLGDVVVDEVLGGAVVGDESLLTFDRDAHEGEHSLEVMVPMIAHWLPGMRILPILVPANERAPAVGEAVAEAVGRLGRTVLYLGSTDLTHYGPRFGFAPQGVGAAGLEWARDVNDVRAIEMMRAMDAWRFLTESRRTRCACGGGPVSAAMAAMKMAGGREGIALGHMTSADGAMGRMHPDDENAVGYAAMLFVR